MSGFNIPNFPMNKSNEAKLEESSVGNWVIKVCMKLVAIVFLIALFWGIKSFLSFEMAVFVGIAWIITSINAFRNDW